MRGMSRRAIFFGCFLLSMGTSILLFRHGLVQTDIQVIRDYWAVLLILWGVSLLFRDSGYRWIMSGIIALCLGFGVVAIFNDRQHGEWTSSGWHFQWHDNDIDNTDNDDEECEDEKDQALSSDSSSESAHGGVHDSVSSTGTPTDSASRHRPVY